VKTDVETAGLETGAPAARTNATRTRRVARRAPTRSLAASSISAATQLASLPADADSSAQPAPASAAGAQRVTIELSPAQVDHVVRGAADGGNMSVLLSGLKDVRDVLSQEPRQMEDSRLSRSLLAGLLMLACFPSDGSYLGNAEIARMLEMNPSTTHRYVSTLVAVGLLERDPATRRYRLV
jgi:IclR-like helix-turn-helix domain-containing protein